MKNRAIHRIILATSVTSVVIGAFVILATLIFPYDPCDDLSLWVDILPNVAFSTMCLNLVSLMAIMLTPNSLATRQEKILRRVLAAGHLVFLLFCVLSPSQGCA